MTAIISAAYSELTRVLPWSIRAQGLKFGHADRLAHLVMRAACVEPDLLNLIAAPDRIVTRPLSQPAEVAPRIYLADAWGLSGIFIAAPLLDWLAARAGARPVVTIVRGGEDMQALQMLKSLAPDYDGNLIIIDTAGWSWVANVTQKVGRTTTAEELALPDEAKEQLQKAQSLAENGDRVLLFWRGSWQPASTATDDFPSALDRVMSRGIDIPAELLDRFYALEMLTWAPTSERSRLQAGFIPKPAPAVAPGATQ